MVASRYAEGVFAEAVGTVECSSSVCLELHVRSGSLVEVVNVGGQRDVRLTGMEGCPEAAEQIVVELANLFATCCARSALVGERATAAVIEEQIFGWDEFEI